MIWNVLGQLEDLLELACSFIFIIYYYFLFTSQKKIDFQLELSFEEVLRMMF